MKIVIDEKKTILSAYIQVTRARIFVGGDMRVLRLFNRKILYGKRCPCHTGPVRMKEGIHKHGGEQDGCHQKGNERKPEQPVSKT